MPKAPRLKLSRSTRMGPSDQINVLQTTPTPPAEPNDLDLSALTISPLHRINVPRTTSNRRDKTENPAPPTLTMDSLGVRAMENGRLTHAAMTHITKTYILSLTEEARARIVVQNHRNPDRKDRRKLKKKPADAVKWYCFVCDDGGYKVDRPSKHEISDLHRCAVIDALELPEAALPEFEKVFICLHCPHIPYRRKDQLQSHLKACHPAAYRAAVKAKQQAKRAKKASKPKRSKPAPAKENIPVPLMDVDTAPEKLSLPIPKLEQQSQHVDSLAESQLIPLLYVPPRQNPSSSALVHAGPVAVTAPLPQPEPHASQGPSRAVEDQPLPLAAPMTVDAVEVTTEPHTIQGSSRLAEDQPTPLAAFMAVDTIDVNPRPLAASVTAGAIEVTPEPKSPVEVLNDLNEVVHPEPLSVEPVLAVAVDPLPQNPWDAGLPDDDDDDPSLSADALFARFCVWS